MYNGNTLAESSITAFWDYYTKDEFVAMQSRVYELSTDKLGEVLDHSENGEIMPCDDE